MYRTPQQEIRQKFQLKSWKALIKKKGPTNLLSFVLNVENF